MNNKTLIIAGLAFFTAFIIACGSGSTESTDGNDGTDVSTQDPSSYDPNRGEGKFDETNVILGEIDPAMVTKGEAISGTKCLSCHKLTEERLVGPGWKGVTKRRTPHWIMNFVTNPDPMIDKDPEVQAQLELCLVRMPNQNLSDEDARNILEFMRQNDNTN